jgi:hypothetical protein
MKVKDKTRIAVAEMKFMRTTTKYTWMNKAKRRHTKRTKNRGHIGQSFEI